MSSSANCAVRVSSAANQVRRFDGGVLRATWWGIRAGADVRRQLKSKGFEDVAAPPPPARLGEDAEWGVVAGLRLTRTSCLVRSIVRQSWYSAHGVSRDLVIGV